MRQLLLEEPPESNGIAVLGGSSFRYLVNVLRVEIGGRLDVRLPSGDLCEAHVVSIDRKSRTVSIKCLQMNHSPNDQPVSVGQSMPPLALAANGVPSIILFQWVIKGSKMDQVVRQATEAGVAIIIPVVGERSFVRDVESLGKEKTSRWERIIREARQQSGSPVSTLLTDPVESHNLPRFWDSLLSEQSLEKDDCLSLVLTEAPLARKTLHEYCVGRPSFAAIAIGPEGGMSAQELELLQTAGFDCVHFKTNILRAETAALYGIAALQVLLTESGKWQLKE